MSSSPSDPFHIAEFRRCGEPANRCPLQRGDGAVLRHGDGRLRCLGVEAQGAAAHRLRGYVSRGGKIGTLQRAAGLDDIMAARLSDEQIVQRLAAMVERREVCLLVSVLDRRGGTPTPRPIATGLTPSEYQPRPAAAPAPPAPVSDTLETVNAMQQAAVLQEASRNGTPFCAVCERANEKANA